MNADKKREAARALQDLENIAKLRKFPPFTDYYLRRVTTDMQRVRDNILFNRDLGKEERWEECIKFWAMNDILKLMVEDEAACRAMLDALPRDEEPEESTSGE